HHGAGGAELLQIVAGEVDQHQVLGALLRVGEQLCAERLVLLRGGPAGPRTGDRMGGGRGAPHADQRFRARTDDVDGLALRVDGAQQVHVRPGVHAPQHAVDAQRGRGEGTTWKISPSMMSRTASCTARSYSSCEVRALGSGSRTESYTTAPPAIGVRSRSRIVSSRARASS